MSDWHNQYWDSPLFVTYLEGVEEERIKVINSLLNQYEAKGLQIVTSSFAIAEVRSYRAPDTPGPSPGAEGTAPTKPIVQEHAAVVREMFASDQLLIRVLTPRVGEMAADIGNQYPDLAPGDCVHIATAIDAGVDVLFTYDGAGKRRRPDAMLRYDGMIGEPPLRILEPWDIWPTLGLLEPIAAIGPDSNPR